MKSSDLTDETHKLLRADFVNTANNISNIMIQVGKEKDPYFLFNNSLSKLHHSAVQPG